MILIGPEFLMKKQRRISLELILYSALMNIKYLTRSVTYLCIIFGITGCRWLTSECANTVYSFELAVKAYPDSENINLGDTIWFEINSSTQFKDEASGTLIYYDKAENLGTSMSFAGILKDSIFPITVDKFNFILKKGNEGASSDIKLRKQFRFPDIGNRYEFLLGLVPKEKGTFSILFSRAATVYRSDDKCTKAAFAINFTDTDQHYELHPYFVNNTGLKGGDYYFVVK
jgi:hypothetical protein